MRPFDFATAKPGDRLCYIGGNHTGMTYVGRARSGEVVFEHVGTVGAVLNRLPPNALYFFDDRRAKQYRCYRSSPDPRIVALERRK